MKTARVNLTGDVELEVEVEWMWESTDANVGISLQSHYSHDYG